MQAERYAAGVRRFDFDQGLAPYDLSSYARWKQLSCYISEQTVQRLAPARHGNISMTAEADPAVLQPATAAEHRLYEQLADGRKQRQGAHVACDYVLNPDCAGWT